MAFKADDFDPEQIVSAPHLTDGPITLRTAVQQTMARPEGFTRPVVIYRSSGVPAILTLNEITQVAALENFKS